jgi:hypothetical protein
LVAAFGPVRDAVGVRGTCTGATLRNHPQRMCVDADAKAL